jgi:hypothetical protein
MRRELFVKNGWKFADAEGYDTNCGTMMKARAAGMRVVGLKPTRCPLPDIQFDAEINRHESVIYGDMIYHHVGATRESRGGLHKSSGAFKSARDRVYEEHGAEWLLEPGRSYEYKMDREEEVAQIKMEMMYRGMIEYLATNNNLFSETWAL